MEFRLKRIPVSSTVLFSSSSSSCINSFNYFTCVIREKNARRLRQVYDVSLMGQIKILYAVVVGKPERTEM